ncbi:hypothetical protein R3P38DRAFT_2774899 [Favolaschia claudopus]|uniref:Uncharacterized protein n=1 Tax=Favolaschia claudopus TaxID=2862362 RepID=A0AAW0BWA2_9AGAR
MNKSLATKIFQAIFLKVVDSKTQSKKRDSEKQGNEEREKRTNGALLGGDKWGIANWIVSMNKKEDGNRRDGGTQLAAPPKGQAVRPQSGTTGQVDDPSIRQQQSVRHHFKQFCKISIYQGNDNTHKGTLAALRATSSAPRHGGSMTTEQFGVICKSGCCYPLQGQMRISLCSKILEQLIASVDSKKFTSIEEFVYNSANKYRAGGGGGDLPQIYTIHAVLLVPLTAAAAAEEEEADDSDANYDQAEERRTRKRAK